MKIGILQTGRIAAELSAKHDDFNNMFIDLLSLTKNNFSFDTYVVCEEHFPKDHKQCDGWIVTGSRHSAYEDKLWIKLLSKLIINIAASKKPILGVCFGHQIVAQALGGEVKKSNKNWVLGLDEYQLDNKPSYMQNLENNITLNVVHQDQVVRPPPDATIYASSVACKYAGLYIGDHVLTIQAHPEFSIDFNKAILNMRSDSIIPKEMVNGAIIKINKDKNKLGSHNFAQTISNFFIHANKNKD